jgi:hypothetical protein
MIVMHPFISVVLLSIAHITTSSPAQTDKPTRCGWTNPTAHLTTTPFATPAKASLPTLPLTSPTLSYTPCSPDKVCFSDPWYVHAPGLWGPSWVGPANWTGTCLVAPRCLTVISSQQPNGRMSYETPVPKDGEIFCPDETACVPNPADGKQYCTTPRAMTLDGGIWKSMETA